MFNPHLHGRRRGAAARALLLASLALLACLGALPLRYAPPAAAAPGATASPTPTPATSVTVPMARALVDLLARGDYAGAATYFDKAAGVNAGVLQTAWKALTAQVGAFRREISTNVSQTGAYQTVAVRCAFARGDIDILVTFNSAQRTVGLHFVPSAPTTAAVPTPPPASYVQPGSFHEVPVQIGSKPWVLPGTLTLPNGPGPFPAVVLVHGSGPEDRDETVGANKPFRDLAWGLASQGIAVLRYDKRTLVYGGIFSPASMAKSHFTVQQETIDDALAAVAVLRTTKAVDPGRIFVLGHSLGGTLAPRIAAEDHGIKGLIIMAGFTMSLEDEILRQTEYLKSVGAITQAAVDAIKAQVGKIKALQPSDAGSAQPLLGATASYWLDLRSYHPTQVATGLSQPMLFLQGGRDYQVTTQDYQGWKAALGSRPNVTFKLYPQLNHLFIAGTGPSTPAEYTRAGHVDAAVIAAIASWIKSQ